MSNVPHTFIAPSVGMMRRINPKKKRRMMKEETQTPDTLLAALPKELQPAGERILRGERLTPPEGLAFLTSKEVQPIVNLANWVRKEQVGDEVIFASTYYIHPTNLCELSCPFCSFYAKPGMSKAWFVTPEEAVARIAKALPLGLNEIHVVGGLWRDCDLGYYEKLFTGIKELDPNLFIKALTPVEYDFLAQLHGLTVSEILERMMSWGLGSLPGGGAEVLDEEIRRKLAPQKLSTDEYLEVHRVAHQLGLPSNITMLYGSIEQPKHLIEHMRRCRDLQDETQGFRTFVPLRYHVENNALGKRTQRLLPPPNLHLLYATARLFLDNFPNIKVLWKYVGIEEATSLLDAGCNDLSSTYVDEKIIEMAGSLRDSMTRERMISLIEGQGRIPLEVHSGYQGAAVA